ncbi:MAG TPA: hypothetical protein VE422_33905 [Terriglobia bacterium]|nr:hypothetical protein [Terriglobia bacterium]
MGAICFSIDPAAVALLVELLHLEVFVETGTFHGDSIAAVADRFLRTFSIEIDPTLCAQAQRRFADRPAVDIRLGASPNVLARLRAEGAFASGRVLFWFDAHWCESAGTDAAGQCPLLEELAAIGAVNGASVIAIDDARLFLAPPNSPHAVEQWPGFDAVLAALRACVPQHHIIVLNDCIWAVPVETAQAFEAYAVRSGVDWLELAEKARNYDLILAQLHEKDAEILRLAGAAFERHNVIETLSQQLHQQIRAAEETAQARVAELQRLAEERRLAVDMIHAEAEPRQHELRAIIAAQEERITGLERVAEERRLAIEMIHAESERGQHELKGVVAAREERVAELELVAEERRLAIETIHAESARGQSELMAIIAAQEKRIAELERIAKEMGHRAVEG